MPCILNDTHKRTHKHTHTHRGQLDLFVEFSWYGGIYCDAHLLRLCLRAVHGIGTGNCLTAGSSRNMRLCRS